MGAPGAHGERVLTTDQTADRSQQKSSPLLPSMDRAGVVLKRMWARIKKERWMEVLHHAV